MSVTPSESVDGNSYAPGKGDAREGWLIVAMTLLVSYAAWARGGTSAGIQPPMIALSVLVWILLFRLRRSRPLALSGRLLRDPVFWFGLLFLTLLTLQWWNSGRTLLYDYTIRRWIYTPPPHPGLPSSIDPKEAREMLYWFFPAFTLILAIRHGLSTRRSIRQLLIGLLINASLLAAFGIVQFLSGTHSLYWRVPLKCHFFASFGYQNHGAAFFYLNFCIALGLCSNALLRRTLSRRMVTLLLAALLLCLAGAHLSLSRGILLLSWATVAVAGVYLGIFHARQMSPAARLNLLAGSVALALCAYYLIVGLAGKYLDNELGPLLKPGRLAFDFDVRFWQVQTATRMWMDNPWFGVGGWGYRHLVGFYVDPAHWALVKELGRANVHNDVLQFLTEFGAVGLTAILLIVAVLAWPFVRVRRRTSPGLAFVAAVGLASVVLYSMVDLPFRCPAVLFTWLAMLAGMGRYLQLDATTWMNGSSEDGH